MATRVQAPAAILEDTVVPALVALVIAASDLAVSVIAASDLAVSVIAASDPDTVSQLVPDMVVALTPETGEQVVVREARL